MTSDLLLTFNAGSSTVKIGIFETQHGRARRIGKAAIDFRRKPLTFHLTEGPQTFDVKLKADGEEHLDDVLTEAFDGLADHFDLGRLTAAGHRVVHGGEVFTGPCAIDGNSLDKIEGLVPLAPLHQPQSLRLIRSMQRLRPSLPQSASFDTAFHRTMDDLTRRFAIPRQLHDEGIKRYGFHGLSYAFIAGALSERMPDIATRKIVVAHLGSGASLCGLKDGESRDTSMSFSTLDGIPMATRSGALDPGVLVHLLNRKGMAGDALEDFLYHQCGLLGVSGISADSRELLDSSRPEAREALDLFALRIAGETARIAGTLGGIDAFVFTAGIGEHQPELRANIATRLAWLGLSLDAQANARNAERISDDASRIAVFVIPTDEEQIIADEALSILSVT